MAADDTGYFRLNCIYAKGAAGCENEKNLRTNRLLFVGKVCTQCLLGTVQVMFKLADKQFREEKETEARLRAEKEAAGKKENSVG